MIKIFGIAIISVLSANIIKNYSSSFATLIQLCAAGMILYCAYPYLCDIVDFIYEYNSFYKNNENILSIVIKALGISLITVFSADICRDNGENALAGKIEFSGKLMMLTGVIPIAKAVTELAVKLIEAG